MNTCDHRQLFKVLFVGLFLASCGATTFKGRVISKKTSKNNDLPATQTPLAEVTASFSYGKGVKPALADYLFVLDNSSSNFFFCSFINFITEACLILTQRFVLRFSSLPGGHIFSSFLFSSLIFLVFLVFFTFIGLEDDGVFIGELKSFM